MPSPPWEPTEVPSNEEIDVESLDRHRVAQPSDYRGGNFVYLVEWETEEGDPEVVQLGAFTSQIEAERLIDYEREAPYSRHRKLRINTVFVHERLKDWLWDAWSSSAHGAIRYPASWCSHASTGHAIVVE